MTEAQAETRKAILARLNRQVRDGETSSEVHFRGRLPRITKVKNYREGKVAGMCQHCKLVIADFDEGKCPRCGCVYQTEIEEQYLDRRNFPCGMSF